MKRKRLLRTLPTLALLLALCLWLAVPGYAAEKSAKVRLADTDGTVTVTKPSGKTLTASKNLSLYTGYQVATGASSYAWISLDESKAVKLDERSSVELRSSDDGKELEVLLLSGKLSTSVDKKLKSDEKMTVRTPNMVTGIRGTFLVATTTEQYLLSGAADVECRDPQTGETFTQSISAGERVSYVGAEETATGQAQPQGGVFVTEQVKQVDVSGFVLTELAQDPQRVQEIFDASGVDLRGVTAEQAEARLAQDEQSSAARLAASQTVPAPAATTVASPSTEQVRQTPLWTGAPLVSASDLLDGNKPAQPSAPSQPNSSSDVSGSSDDTDDTDDSDDWHSYTPPVYYTIRWYDEDGTTLLGTTSVAAGMTPYRAAPKKAPNADYSYAFSHWEPTIGPAVADAAYKAVYTATEREYTLAFLDENGSTVTGGSFAHGTVQVNIAGKDASPAAGTGLYTAHAGDAVSLIFTGQSDSLYGLEELKIVEAKVDGKEVPLDPPESGSSDGGTPPPPPSRRTLENGCLQTVCSFTMPADNVSAKAVFSMAHRLKFGSYEAPNQKLEDQFSVLYRIDVKNDKLGGQLMYSKDNMDLMQINSQEQPDLCVLSGETIYLCEIVVPGNGTYVFADAPSAEVNGVTAESKAISELDPQSSDSGFALMVPFQQGNNADLVLSGTIMRQGDCVVTLTKNAEDTPAPVSVFVGDADKDVFGDTGRFVFGAKHDPATPVTIRLVVESGMAELSLIDHDASEKYPPRVDCTPGELTGTFNCTVSVGDAKHITLTVSTKPAG